MNSISVFNEYCTGCGLCHSVKGVDFRDDEKGFKCPNLKEEHASFCKIACPSSGNALRNYQDGSIWGAMKKSFLGWSSDEQIRFMASSGGVTTVLCIYLLEKNMVDGIIQVKKDPQNPCETINVISRSKEEVLECMGSRYTTSSPLMQIKQQVKEGERYAFVGKPCDASALRMYKESHSETWTEQIAYIFSFFCAGQPSKAANIKLISSLGCKDESDCKDLSYRGNGWPGKAQAWNNAGDTKTMDYETSWMKILGRDVRKYCRFCADGTGEMADISCGDAWYLKEDGRPDIFTEHPGQNAIFARTEAGAKLIDMAIKDGVITVKDFDPDKDLLHKRQPYHYARKASLSSLKLAMWLCGRNFPMYDRKKLAMFAKDFPLKSKIYRCVGTIQRVWKKVL